MCVTKPRKCYFAQLQSLAPNDPSAMLLLASARRSNKIDRIRRSKTCSCCANLFAWLVENGANLHHILSHNTSPCKIHISVLIVGLFEPQEKKQCIWKTCLILAHFKSSCLTRVGWDAEKLEYEQGRGLRSLKPYYVVERRTFYSMIWSEQTGYLLT